MSVDPSELPISDGTLQRIRQLLRPDFARATLRAYINNLIVPRPTVVARADNVLSSGAAGPYVLAFDPAVLHVAPIVIAWCSKDGFGNIVLLNVDTVTKEDFSFDMHIATSGAAVNAGQVILVEWIAIGA